MTDSTVERQRQILDLLQMKPVLATNELVEKLGVSAMTVHRDLNKLEATGVLVRTHGRVSAAPFQKGRERAPADICAMCGRTVPARTAFILRTPQRGYLSACCPHCGLALLDGEPSVELALVTDFLYGRMIGASDAAYLAGCRVLLCCEPSILAFAGPDQALGFQKGFGGEIMGLAQALDYLRSKMAIISHSRF